MRYKFIGGPANEADFEITEELLSYSTVQLYEIFVSILQQWIPTLRAIEVMSWPDREAIVLDTGLSKHFYRVARSSTPGLHIYRFNCSICKPLPPRLLLNCNYTCNIQDQPLGFADFSVADIPSNRRLKLVGTPPSRDSIISWYNIGIGKNTEVPTTHCFECEKEVPISDTYTKKNDPNYALCESCFTAAKDAGRAKEVTK